MRIGWRGKFLLVGMGGWVCGEKAAKGLKVMQCMGMRGVGRGYITHKLDHGTSECREHAVSYIIKLFISYTVVTTQRSVSILSI